MRILVGWNDASQSDLLQMYLGVNEREVHITGDAEEFAELIQEDGWDLVLFSISFPDHEQAFENFTKLREIQSDVSVVGVCRPDEIYRLASFLTQGMRAYLIEDPNGDFMFLLNAVVEGVQRQLEAERERQIAEKLRREIDSVRQLQESIIPTEISCPEGFDVVARYESSQIRVLGGNPVTMAGGDYYDGFTLPDGTVVVLVGDASGHGMKACMSIMTMHTIIRMMRGDQFRDPGKFVTHVNDLLSQQKLVNGEGGFITMMYGLLTPETGEFLWASAGHPSPLCHILDSGEVEEIGGPDSAGIPIGIMSGFEFQTQRFEIPVGSRLMIYTDGVVEAFPPDGETHEEFGLAGVRKSLRESAAAPLSEALDKLFAESEAFTKGEGRHDDTSVLLVQRDRQL